MDYKAYYEAYKAHWDTVKQIDDSLAVWAEKAYPGYSMFYWEPENEEMVRVYIHLNGNDLSYTLPVDELI